MEKQPRVGALYGYTVCLVAVVTFLIGIHSLLQGAFRYADPLASADEFRMGFEPSLTSFDAFRATYLFGPRSGLAVVTSSPDTAKQRPDTMSTADLRTRYEALRAERVTQVRYGAARDLTTNLVLLGVAVALFISHWRWLRGRERANDQIAAPA